jgi:hypothetical protein
VDAMSDFLSMSGHGGTRVVAAEGNDSNEGQVKLDVQVPNPSGTKHKTRKEHDTNKNQITLGILLRVSCAPLPPSPWHASASILSHRPGFPHQDLGTRDTLIGAGRMDPKP